MKFKRSPAQLVSLHQLINGFSKLSNLCSSFTTAIRRKKAAPGAVAEKGADYTEIVGKDFYRADTVNEGHYSKKRADVADVDPKVTSIFLFLTIRISA